MAIDQQIAVFPPFPKRLTEGRIYVPQMDAALNRLETLDTELNTWGQEANQLQIEINSAAQSASADSDTAQNAATVATNKATQASDYKDSIEALAAAVMSAMGLPSLTGNAGKRLTVLSNEMGVAWIGGFAHPAYINNAATGTVDLNLKAATVFELTLTGDVTLNAINLPTGNERSVAYLNGTNLGSYAVTSNIDFSSVALLAGYSVSQMKKTGRTFTPDAAAGSELAEMKLSNAGDKLIVMGKGSSNASIITVYHCNQGLDSITLHSSHTIDYTFTGLDVFAISDDGTKMVVRKWASNEVAYWTLSTPWDATTLTKIGVIAPAHYSSIGYIYAMAFSGDGARFYVVDGDSSLLWWDIPTAFDISSIASGPAGSTQITSSNMGLASLTILPNHSGLIITNGYNDDTHGRRLEKWAFPSIGNPVGATLAEVSTSLYADMNVPRRSTFINDGSRVIAFGNTKTLHEYDIQTSQIITLHQVGNTIIARNT
ncbi:hypothetical protein [Neptunomonas sp.]|uniref:hypothetical protein n=1 Tax=Neptunomonas sp. TaxID=1971898 RepID=UPI0025E384C2|nr:hypothetical protein [Neptunomonas sp.]